MTAYSRLLAEAGRLETSDPGAAAIVLAEAAAACTMAAEIPFALETARRAQKVAAQSAGPVPLLVDVVLASALVLSGKAEEASASIDQLLGRTAAVGPGDAHGARYLIHLLMICERLDQARALLSRFTSEAGSVEAIPHELALLSELEFRCGDLPAAYAAGVESVRLGHETVKGSTAGYSLAVLTRVEAAQGRDDECRAHVADAVDVAREDGNRLVYHYAHAALGLLELGRGNLDEARALFESVSRLALVHGVREPNQGQWQPDHVEVLTRSGDNDAALQALESFETDVALANRIWSQATAARCRGYLSENDYAEQFEEALRLHLSAPTPSAFEMARTRLCYGEVLRRKRERVAAREQLRAAYLSFEQLGAQPWAARAASELRATGERARRRSVATRRELTPQELQVAMAVAGGATNREVAAHLFLSPKTVESHLSSLYRKLEIRSRTDLALLFAQRMERKARPIVGSLETWLLASFAALAEFQQQVQDGLLTGAWS